MSRPTDDNDPLEKVEQTFKKIRGVREAAYRLGYAEGRLHKHLESLTSDEKSIVGAAVERFNATLSEVQRRDDKMGALTREIIGEAI